MAPQEFQIFYKGNEYEFVVFQLGLEWVCDMYFYPYMSMSNSYKEVISEMYNLAKRAHSELYQEFAIA